MRVESLARYVCSLGFKDSLITFCVPILGIHKTSD